MSAEIDSLSVVTIACDELSLDQIVLSRLFATMCHDLLGEILSLPIVLSRFAMLRYVGENYAYGLLFFVCWSGGADERSQIFGRRLRGELRLITRQKPRFGQVSFRLIPDI